MSRSAIHLQLASNGAQARSIIHYAVAVRGHQILVMRYLIYVHFWTLFDHEWYVRNIGAIVTEGD